MRSERVECEEQPGKRISSSYSKQNLWESSCPRGTSPHPSGDTGRVSFQKRGKFKLVGIFGIFINFPKCIRLCLSPFLHLPRQDQH